MMPAQLAGALPNTGGVDLALSGVTNGDWLVLVSGILIGVLTIGVAVAIAWWQRLIQLRDRSADRAEQRQRELSERERQQRLADRDAWEAEYLEIRELLKLGERVAYQVVHEGPYIADELTGLGVARFRMEADQLASRCPQALHAPLLSLAKRAELLTQSAVPDPHTIEAAYATGGPVPARLGVRAGQLLAIQQDRAARELGEEVGIAWKVLRDEWGS